MLVLWMLYATAFAAIVAGGALALERLAAIWDVPRRTVWCAAVVVAIATPVFLALNPNRAPRWMEPSAPVVVEMAVQAAVPIQRVQLASEPSRLFVPPSFSARWNAPALAAWIGASAVLLVIFLRGVWIMNRRRGEWERASVDGNRVLIAQNAGPAVVGALKPEIVLPSWMLVLDATERALVLRHESEHVAARDPLLLTLGGLSLVLFPWNAALWFIVRRLRLATEIDCDARVLRSVASPRDYGMLLLAVGARRSLALPLSASLTERQLDLERRIIAMTSLRPSRPVFASLPFIGVLCLAAAVAAQTPHPGPLTHASAAPAKAIVPAAASAVAAATVTGSAHAAIPATAVGAASAGGAGSAAAAIKPAVAKSSGPLVPAVADTDPVLASDQVVKRDVEATITARKAMEAGRVGACCLPLDTLAAWVVKHQPDVMRGDNSIRAVIFVVDADGHYVSSVVNRQEHDAATDAAVARAKVVLDTMTVMRSAMNDEVVSDTAATKLRALAAELKAREALVGSKALRLNTNALDIPRESIQSVDVQKFQAGVLSPNPIGVVTVVLKRD